MKILQTHKTVVQENAYIIYNMMIYNFHIYKFVMAGKMRFLLCVVCVDDANGRVWGVRMLIYLLI